MRSEKQEAGKRFAVLISPCILSPGLQAERKPGTHWGYPFLALMMQYGVDVIPLPCSESSFCGFQEGLRRRKHGVKYYESLEPYVHHCEHLAAQTADMVADMQKGGYHFLCMLGVEHSPSCAVSLIYSNEGTLKRAGIFFQSLQREFALRGIEIPQIGIIRHRPKKALARLEQALSSSIEIENREG